MQTAFNSPPQTDSVQATQVHSADAQACQQALNGGSKSFHAASLLLPKAFAKDATALYAFCRLTDDLIDDAVESASSKDRSDIASDPTSAAQQVMHSLFERLDQLYQGQPFPHAADRALLEVVQRHQLPKSLFLSLFEGFEWDASGREYETIEDVYSYGARVAGTVGVMMSVLMGVRDANMIARAADLGVAMQLTNIARDVGEDARAGRLYLPRAWMREAGIDIEQFLAKPVFSPALKQVILRLLDYADTLYAKADSGIALLPRGVRPGMYAARLLYAEIGAELKRLDCNSVQQRAVVSTAAKARVLTQLAKLPFLTSQQLRTDALDQTLYLVDIVAAQAGVNQTPARMRAAPNLTGVSSKAGWVMDLFGELDKRDTRLATMPRKSKVSAL